jgi:hypothetical protein
MGSAIKITLIIAIVFSLMVFSIIGLYIQNDITYKINSLENQLIAMDKRREYYAEQVISLQGTKANIENQIALEVDRTQQKELQAQLIALNNEQTLSAQQRIAAEQARLDALRQQQLQAQQQAQVQKQATKVVTKTTTAKTRTRAS